MRNDNEGKQNNSKKQSSIIPCWGRECFVSPPPPSSLSFAAYLEREQRVQRVFFFPLVKSKLARPEKAVWRLGLTLPFTLQWDSNHGCCGVEFLLIFLICWPSNIVSIGPHIYSEYIVKSDPSAETMDWPLGYASHQRCFADPMRVEEIVSSSCVSSKCLGICL